VYGVLNVERGEESLLLGGALNFVTGELVCIVQLLSFTKGMALKSDIHMTLSKPTGSLIAE